MCMEKKVSIVVPIYNVEKYVNKCIEYLTQQTYTNLEIILVDDMSTDASSNICDSWALRDERIKVIHKQNNEGLGMARNTGLENATGEYLCFCDGDDFYQKDTIETIVEVAKNNKSDLVFFGHNDVNMKGEVIRSFIPDFEKKVYEEDEIIQYFLPTLIFKDPIKKTHRNIMLSSCMILYSRRIIEQTSWRFVSEREIISEDYYSLLVLMKDVHRISVVNRALYNYTYNEASLSRRYDETRIRKNNFCYRKMLDVCKENNYPTIVIQSLSSLYLNNILASVKAMVSQKKKNECKTALARFVADDDVQYAISNIKMANENTQRRLFVLACRLKLVNILFILVRISIRNSGRIY